MNRIGWRIAMTTGILVLGVFGIVGTGSLPPITPITTLVGVGVGTLVKTSGMIDVTNTCNPATPAAPDVQAWWNAMPPANRIHPFVGFDLWRNTTDGCTTSRIDVYRALATFNMASVSQLKGLVTKAELIVKTRALPAGVTAGNPGCIPFTGGAGTLERFGPAAAALPPVSGAGTLDRLQPADPFPSGTLVFTLPRPWVAGSVAGAARPTTTTPDGQGGATFVVDVTDQVNAALNGGLPAMSWLLTSALEGPLSAPVAPGGLDCKTSYTFELKLIHL
jgi:hypothetical protein